jgi:hypothetical protein
MRTSDSGFDSARYDNHCDQGTGWLSAEVPFDYSGPEASKNQALAGTRVHPRTLVAPLIVPPAYDFEYWGANQFVKYPSMINRPRQQDLEASGYVSVCRQPKKVAAGASYMNEQPPPSHASIMEQQEQDARSHLARKFVRESSLGRVDPDEDGSAAFIENIDNGMYKDPFGEGCNQPNFDPSFNNANMKSPCTWGCSPPLPDAAGSGKLPAYVRPISNLSTCAPCNTRLPPSTDGLSPRPNPARVSPDVIENFAYVDQRKLSSGYGSRNSPYSNNTQMSQTPREPYYDTLVREESGAGQFDEYVNKSCGYDAQAPRHGLQVNKCTGPMQQSEGYVNYNKNMAAQIVQPGMYFQSEVLQPLNSNIGISFNQQLNPRTATLVAPGEVMYTEMDGGQYVGENRTRPVLTGEELHNVYDPRFTGYASNDRFYIDEMTGQPRFFYDDIDAVVNPSYIVRSNVDHMGCFDQTGAMKEGELDFDYRSMANTAFHESALDFRTDVQIGLAQMRYSRLAQLREAPIRTQ